MQMTIKCLAILVVAMCLNGCYALTGCPGSSQCDPNVAAGTAGTDGGSTGDASSGVEVDGDTTKDPCLPYKWIDSPGWDCSGGGAKFAGGQSCDFKAVINAVITDSNYICAISCPQMGRYWKIGKNLNEFWFSKNQNGGKNRAFMIESGSQPSIPPVVCEQYEK